MKLIIEEDFDLHEVAIVNKFIKDMLDNNIKMLCFICPENQVEANQ